MKMQIITTTTRIIEVIIEAVDPTGANIMVESHIEGCSKGEGDNKPIIEANTKATTDNLIHPMVAIMANQAPSPRQTTQELMQIFGKGRGQAHREELHRQRPFGARTRSLQSRIQRKIRKTQWMRQRYANAQ